MGNDIPSGGSKKTNNDNKSNNDDDIYSDSDGGSPKNDTKSINNTQKDEISSNNDDNLQKGFKNQKSSIKDNRDRDDVKSHSNENPRLSKANSDEKNKLNGMENHYNNKTFAPEKEDARFAKEIAVNPNRTISKASLTNHIMSQPNNAQIPKHMEYLPQLQKILSQPSNPYFRDQNTNSKHFRTLSIHQRPSINSTLNSNTPKLENLMKETKLSTVSNELIKLNTNTSILARNANESSLKNDILNNKNVKYESPSRFLGANSKNSQSSTNNKYLDPNISRVHYGQDGPAQKLISPIILQNQKMSNLSAAAINLKINIQEQATKRNYKLTQSILNNERSFLAGKNNSINSNLITIDHLGSKNLADNSNIMNEKIADHSQNYYDINKYDDDPFRRIRNMNHNQNGSYQQPIVRASDIKEMDLNKKNTHSIRHPKLDNRKIYPDQIIKLNEFSHENSNNESNSIEKKLFPDNQFTYMRDQVLPLYDYPHQLVNNKVFHYRSQSQNMPNHNDYLLSSYNNIDDSHPKNLMPNQSKLSNILKDIQIYPNSTNEKQYPDHITTIIQRDNSLNKSNKPEKKTLLRLDKQNNQTKSISPEFESISMIKIRDRHKNKEIIQKGDDKIEYLKNKMIMDNNHLDFRLGNLNQVSLPKLN